MYVEGVDNQSVDKDSKVTTLIVVLAFDTDEMGELVPATEPTQWPSEDRAKQVAKVLAKDHAGVIAWSRSADPLIGEYGEPVLLAQYGEVPPME